MHHQGHQFFQAKNGVWLIKAVPADILQESSKDSAIT
jgi:RNA:NAD 2'-phosphotransferase (TPT1/KptA family)